MVSQTFPAAPTIAVAPTQVWPALAVEIQGRIISLLAILAANLALAQFQVPALQNKEEVPNALTPQ